MSDVHIDRNRSYDVLNSLADLPADCNTIVLAGDVSDDVMQTSRWIADLKKRTDRLIFVPGNHDFYNRGLNRSKIRMDNNDAVLTYKLDGPVTLVDGWPMPRTVHEIYNHYQNWCDSHGIIMLNKSSIVIDDVTFIGGTGWHDFVAGEPYSQSQQVLEWYENGSDPDYIIWNKNGSTKDAVMTEAMLEYVHINEAVRNATGKVVVVTHHLPHRELSWARPEMDVWTKLLGMYVNSLMETIVSPKIKYWCYGHTHRRNIKDIHGITYVCNPVGYPNENSRWKAIDFEV